MITFSMPTHQTSKAIRFGAQPKPSVKSAAKTEPAQQDEAKHNQVGGEVFFSKEPFQVNTTPYLEDLEELKQQLQLEHQKKLIEEQKILIEKAKATLNKTYFIVNGKNYTGKFILGTVAGLIQNNKEKLPKEFQKDRKLMLLIPVLGWLMFAITKTQQWRNPPKYPPGKFQGMYHRQLQEKFPREFLAEFNQALHDLTQVGLLERDEHVVSADIRHPYYVLTREGRLALSEFPKSN